MASAATSPPPKVIPNPLASAGILAGAGAGAGAGAAPPSPPEGGAGAAAGLGPLRLSTFDRAQAEASGKAIAAQVTRVAGLGTAGVAAFKSKPIQTLGLAVSTLALILNAVCIVVPWWAVVADPQVVTIGGVRSRLGLNAYATLTEMRFCFETSDVSTQFPLPPECSNEQDPNFINRRECTAIELSFIAPVLSYFFTVSSAALGMVLFALVFTMLAFYTTFHMRLRGFVEPPWLWFLADGNAAPYLHGLAALLQLSSFAEYVGKVSTAYNANDLVRASDAFGLNLNLPYFSAGVFCSVVAWLCSSVCVYITFAHRDEPPRDVASPAKLTGQPAEGAKQAAGEAEAAAEAAAEAEANDIGAAVEAAVASSAASDSAEAATAAAAAAAAATAAAPAAPAAAPAEKEKKKKEKKKSSWGMISDWGGGGAKEEAVAVVDVVSGAVAAPAAGGAAAMPAPAGPAPAAAASAETPSGPPLPSRRQQAVMLASGGAGRERESASAQDLSASGAFDVAVDDSVASPAPRTL